ncbi:hypothetical protein A3L09_01780 [Thermococcus profundus]|uniref:KaiC-like domain-containing protein n=1 Tax=Thermococcus profundus TaxID=49899 RepID=A0A2Z2M9L3_THEPR|nr:hypothetical protein [Thermococcus profundus]ASJ02083.1 hypothetical protein A3L09_01780 [Thermococcus profundus]
MEALLEKFRPSVVGTGIKDLDEMLGGGLIRGGIILFVYDASSFGWTVGVQIFRRIIEDGNGFGIVTSYSFPPSLLEKYALSMNYDVLEHASHGELVIIDVLGSLYDARVDLPFVYYPGKLDPETFLAKLEATYRKIFSERLGGRTPIEISVTMDALPSLFGEEAAIKILRRSLVNKELTLVKEEGWRPTNIFLINRERASRYFLEWLSQYAEHIIEFRPSETPGVERMIVKKSLLPDFVPRTAEFRFKKGEIEIFPE